MKGDFSRQTFSPRNHYSAVLMQQGRVQLDADWNEQAAINQHRIETEARDLVGPSGAPAHNAGFAIGVSGETLEIGRGDYYVEGILCENEDSLLFGSQRDLPGMDPVGILTPGGAENGVGLVYLDVWERHLTAVEDDQIREAALGGPDTATRKRTVWQTKVLRLGGADTTSDPANLQARAAEHRELTEQLAEAADEAQRERLRTELRRVGDEILELLEVDRHGSFADELRAAHPLSTGRMLADTGDPPAGASGAEGSPGANGSARDEALQLLRPGAGYELLENQLYRIEVHKGGAPGTATFKWSRDNGSVVTPVLRIPYGDTGSPVGTEIAVRDVGNDETLGFAPGQYVELVSDDRELNGQPGQLLRIVGVNAAKRTITVGERLTPVKAEDAAAFHYKLRRWDYPPDREMPQDGVEIPPGEGFVGLEGGIRVKFSAGHYNTGDYWLVPARTATGDIEWPKNASRPPAGVEHRYSPLALVMLATTTTEDEEGPKSERLLLMLADLRRLFTPLTEMAGLFYLGGDGQAALPLRRLAQPLVVGVASGGRPVQGARVRFEVRSESPAAYDGHLAAGDADETGAKSLTVTTDARGEARCFWTLAKEEPGQQVRASLADGTHLPVYFSASLSTDQAASESIRVDKVALGEQELQLNGDVPATALADGEIRVMCREAIDEEIVKRRPPCNLTLEIPFPQSESDKRLWGEDEIGFQPLVLAAEVDVSGDVISWRPQKQASDWLKNTLFVTLTSTEISARFTMKGDFTFPSAGFGRADDLELWFRVVKDPVRLNPLTLESDSVTGQTRAVTGTVNLVGPAPAGGVTVNLTTDNANLARVEQTAVTVAAGQTSQSFRVNTTAVATDTPVTITAAFEQQTRSATLTVRSPVLENLTVDPTTLFGRSQARGTVSLSGPAPAGGVGVSLSSASPSVARVPQTVSIPAGSASNATPFAIETEPVANATPVTITASFKGDRQRALTVQPPVLNALTLATSSVTGGAAVSGNVGINAPAPANFAVGLRSTDTTAATVPESVTIPQNATAQGFSATTKAVSSRRDLSIVASRGGTERSVPLAVQPPRLSSFGFSPSRIPNAGRSTGTLTLNGPAPANTVVNLALNNDFTATVPNSVSVPAGATQITFDAFGKMFTDQARSVTVQAFYLGTSLSVSLTVDAGKAKEKEKEFEKIELEKEFEKLRDKEFEKFRDDIEIQPFSIETPAEAPATEEPGSERSFIRPEERPDPDGRTSEDDEPRQG